MFNIINKGHDKTITRINVDSSKFSNILKKEKFLYYYL